MTHDLINYNICLMCFELLILPFDYELSVLNFPRSSVFLLFSLLYSKSCEVILTLYCT